MAALPLLHLQLWMVHAQAASNPQAPYMSDWCRLDGRITTAATAAVLAGL